MTNLPRAKPRGYGWRLLANIREHWQLYLILARLCQFPGHRCHRRAGGHGVDVSGRLCSFPQGIHAARFVFRPVSFHHVFSGGLIPTYLTIKSYGMSNTIWAVVLPNAITMYYVIIVRTYFTTNLPHELYEAAAIDGCSDIRFFLTIALPLAIPIIAVMAMFYIVDRWNMYFRPLIYLTDRKKYPLQLIIRELVASSNMTPEMLEGFAPSEYSIMLQITSIMKYGVIIIASLPVLIIYPFVQKYFVKGIMVGAVKG